MIAVLASLLLASGVVATNETPKAAFPADVSARELVEGCRTMIPTEIELKGRLVLRNRRGISLAEHAYVLTRTEGMTTLVVDGETVTAPGPDAAASGSILGTDVTWSDLTLDYLWWDEFTYDETKESETVYGQVCSVVVLKKGDRLIRIWVDRKTGALMQAEEMKAGRPVRRLWGTRIKKFGDRWSPNVMEVETLGSGHRTKIIVEEMK